MSSHELTYQHPALGYVPAPVRDRASLVFETATGLTASSLGEGGALVVGRAEPADVVIDDRSLSRTHARFVLKDGVVHAQDLGSTNGMRIDGERVTACVLDEGETLELGSVRVTVSGVARRNGRGPIAGFTAFRHALRGELERASVFGRSFALLALHAPAETNLVEALSPLLRSVDVGTVYMPGLVLVLLPETSASDGAELSRRIALKSVPNARAALVSYPEDATDFEALIDVAVHTVRSAGSGTVARPTQEKSAARTGPVVISDATQRLYGVVDRIARASMPVLVLGETGSGKELVSRAVHEKSARAKAPFVAINCASIPANLIESVLFGHEKGAFTGATDRRVGVFEQAHGGSVFLDEVGELTPAVQAALLRVLETKKVTRVGANKEIDVDVRVIAATHRDLPQMVATGAFREDLMFRLDALSLRVPPLRERPEEVEPLAQLFLAGARKEWGVAPRGIDAEATALLKGYRWPGNVRQLKNVIERAAVICLSNEIGVDDLPEALKAQEAPVPPKASEVVREGAANEVDAGLSLTDRVDAFEARLIREALKQTGGNQTKAAVMLKIPRRTLTNKIHALGIDA